MAEIWNPGSDIIEAFLKGVAVKNQKEAKMQQFQHQLQMQKLAEMKAEQQQRQFDARLNETKDWHKGQMDLNNKRFEQTLKLFKYQIAEGLQKGTIKLNPEHPDGFEFTEPGTAQKIATQGKVDEKRALIAPTVEEAQALIPVKALQAGEISKAELPARTNFALIQSELQGKAARAQRDWQAQQNELTRRANRDNTLLRVNATLSNKQATADEKNAVAKQMVDDYLPDILSGAPEGTLEALPKGEAGLKLRNGIKAQGYNILTKKQAENLDGMKRLQGFHEKADALRALIADGTVKNFSEIKQLQGELAADLVIFGREAKAEKGVVTDKDIDRLKGAIPEIIPGGWSAALSKNKNAANQRRVDSILDAYHEKFYGVVGPKMKPEQEQAIRERYGILPRKAPSHLERVQ